MANHPYRITRTSPPPRPPLNAWVALKDMGFAQATRIFAALSVVAAAPIGCVAEEVTCAAMVARDAALMDGTAVGEEVVAQRVILVSSFKVKFAAALPARFASAKTLLPRVGIARCLWFESIELDAYRVLSIFVVRVFLSFCWPRAQAAVRM
ncbi:hypothetical protein CTheo_8975 [Ceratobasidium theobromae]|uniref:Uncharacterized protein n=1 Tax=Ceratobasidium theobromae TaxID=1582974 RepID=A0A5N5Q846_9AGAM|nr:hypothetical protein CTheo_8975 [Ceratobasidium theobromae]